MTHEEYCRKYVTPRLWDSYRLVNKSHYFQQEEFAKIHKRLQTLRMGIGIVPGLVLLQVFNLSQRTGYHTSKELIITAILSGLFFEGFIFLFILAICQKAVTKACLKDENFFKECYAVGLFGKIKRVFR